MNYTKPNEQLVSIGRSICDFYTTKYADENQVTDYAAAEKAVKDLNVVDITVHNNEIHIYCGRPGHLIGRHGSNIEKLQKHLGMAVRVHESFHWNDILVPYDYTQF